MNKKALIFWGGWEGHEPEAVSLKIAEILNDNCFDVRIENNMDILAKKDYLMSLDLIIPCWTMGEIKNEYVENISDAVISGVGLAGCHGGMCDAFRDNTDWQFITGGQWVAHPGGDNVTYSVNICADGNPITVGVKDFSLTSEQYYMHIDPAIEVLANTKIPVADGPHCTNKPIDMPVVWTKLWGKGRVFYNSLGHHADLFETCPEFKKIMKNGLLWAAEGKTNN